MSKLDRALEELPDTESDLLRRALEDPGVQHKELETLLRSCDIDVSETAVRRWRARS